MNRVRGWFRGLTDMEWGVCCFLMGLFVGLAIGVVFFAIYF